MRGFGLIEVLIAGVVGFIIMFGVMTMMKTAGDGQKRVDVKNEVQNLDSRVKNLLSTDVTCKALFVDQLPAESRIFTPTALSAYNDTDKSQALVKLPSGEILKTGSSTNNRFKISSLKLRLIAELPPAGTGKWDATIMMGTDSRDSRGRDLAGGEFLARTFPLIVVTEAVPSSPDRKIVGCYGRGGVNAKETCEVIGGRWIESLTKCFFGGDLKLNQFECVDAAEFNPGGPLEGAVVDICYYKPNAFPKFKTYSCPNIDSPNYWQCKCVAGSNAATSGWQIRKPTTFLRACDGGVVIRIPDQSVYYLKENEYSEEVFFNGGTTTRMTTAQMLQAHDTESANLECLYDPIDSVRAYKCLQDRSLDGRVGSCVFINGGRYSDPVVRNNASGWIYVTAGRALVARGSGTNTWTDVLEARGRKCYFVKKVAGTDSVLTSRFKNTTDPTPIAGEETNLLLHEDRHKDIKECLFMGGQTASEDPNPPAVYPFRGAYIKRFPCDNSEGIDLLNLTGEVAGTKPTLDKGMCWYFQNARLGAQFRKNLGVNQVDRSYTGWVYLTRDLPDNLWDAIAGTNIVKPLAGLPAVPVLSAVPCNVGVRISIQN